jgi:hypothetical protein
MSFKTVKQSGPDWLPRAVVCRVWDNNKEKHTASIVSTDVGRYFDSDGFHWDHAEPIAEWEPVVGKYHAFWNNENTQFVVAIYEGVGLDDRYVGDHGNIRRTHIARIKNDDGTPVDLDCTVEELKGRTDWK